MKLPAIQGQIGNTVFYSSVMKFKDIAQYVKRVNDEFHHNTCLSDMIQRSITENVGNIVSYIRNQPDRFFNSVVLAIYHGQPQWIEVEMTFPSDAENTYSGLGFLEFNGEEKIFPVDGQHRVEAIKKAIIDDKGLEEENIGVIFIAHSIIPDGVEKTRRIFSTLNRYAKPVSKSDIIALDEDDIIALATRRLIENHELFNGNRVSDTLGKSIPSNDRTAFTSIIALYECNSALLTSFRPELKKPKAVKKLLRTRPPESEIDEFYKYLKTFWDTLIVNIKGFKEYLIDSKALRNNNNGGHLLFRPIGLIPFIDACVRIKIFTDDDFSVILSKFSKLDFSVNNELWSNVVWNPVSHLMIMENKILTKRLFLYLYSPLVQTVREREKTLADYKSKKNSKDEEAILEKSRLN